ncbi:hypothetical protein [Streptomyces sp. NPDC048639]|uniref:hypothetical protein n=1 Tax=Streptomyces sp. NPDC048639 TaxID=3365581 RepID=UPI003719E393
MGLRFFKPDLRGERGTHEDHRSASDRTCLRGGRRQMGALEQYKSGTTYDTEVEVVDHENYRNWHDRHHSGDTLNTYPIEITAQKVH